MKCNVCGGKMRKCKADVCPICWGLLLAQARRLKLNTPDRRQSSPSNRANPDNRRRQSRNREPDW